MRELFVKILLHLFASLPLPVTHFFGAIIGWALIYLPNDARRISRINLELCYPELTPSALKCLLHKSLIEDGKTATELGPFWLVNDQRVLSLIKQTSGEEELKGSFKTGKGVILVIPHLGAWEMVGLYCSSRYPMTSLYRPPQMSTLDNLIHEGRERMGAKLVPTDLSGTRSLYKALQKGELVAILPDQDPTRGNGVFVPFFGIPAYTMTLLPRLAHKTEADVFFAYAERLPKGQGYHLHFRAAPEITAAADIEESAALINKGIELCINAIPEQYQWGYKRFRTRPEGQDRFY